MKWIREAARRGVLAGGLSGARKWPRPTAVRVRVSQKAFLLLHWSLRAVCWIV